MINVSVNQLNPLSVSVLSLSSIDPQVSAITGTIKGKDGYTPIKGTDYFTEEDKELLVEDVVEIVTNNSSNAQIRYKTLSLWNSMIGLIPRNGQIIVYTDIYKIKIGDGLAYLVDLPFIDESTKNELELHKLNTISHITSELRQLWNNKVSILDVQDLTLIFSI